MKKKVEKQKFFSDRTHKELEKFYTTESIKEVEKHFSSRPNYDKMIEIVKKWMIPTID